MILCGGLAVDGLGWDFPVAHSRRPSLVGSEGYSPTPLSCGFGEQQAALGITLNGPPEVSGFRMRD